MPRLIKELVPIVLAAALWGRERTVKTVMAHCDNAAVVAVLNKGSSKEGEVIKGKDNDLANALSRGKDKSFLSRHPQAQPQPTPLPAELLDLV